MNPKEEVEKNMASIYRPSNILHAQSVYWNRNYDRNHGTDKTAKGKSIRRNEKKAIKKTLDKARK